MASALDRADHDALYVKLLNERIHQHNGKHDDHGQRQADAGGTDDVHGGVYRLVAGDDRVAGILHLSQEFVKQELQRVQPRIGYIQLGRKKVVIWDHTQPKRVQDHVIVVDREGTEETLPFDLLVLAQGQIADDALAKALQGCGKEVLEAGDCLGARTIFYAVQEAFQAAYFLS